MVSEGERDIGSAKLTEKRGGYTEGEVPRTYKKGETYFNPGRVNSLESNLQCHRGTSFEETTEKVSFTEESSGTDQVRVISRMVLISE